MRVHVYANFFLFETQNKYEQYFFMSIISDCQKPSQHINRIMGFIGCSRCSISCIKCQQLKTCSIIKLLRNTEYTERVRSNSNKNEDDNDDKRQFSIGLSSINFVIRHNRLDRLEEFSYCGSKLL